jgi:hypothetical protein
MRFAHAFPDLYNAIKMDDIPTGIHACVLDIIWLKCHTALGPRNLADRETRLM